MDLIKFVNDNSFGIQSDGVTNITKNKIKYIREYVRNWLFVANNSGNNINYIDCMCNAGIYNDCTLSTSMEVLKLFVEASKANPTKNYNIFLNDINNDRVEVIKKLSKLIKGNANVNIFYSCKDVNKYIENIDEYDYYLLNKSFTILFVDPYNFGDVRIKLIHDFAIKYYSEIIFNYFSSDIRRNGNNESAPNKSKKITDSMQGVPGYCDGLTPKEILKLIQDYFKESKIKYSFAYEFRVKTNVDLYYIVFSTPHLRGLQKLKDVLWDVFSGDLYYKNKDESKKQLSLFDVDELKIEYYAKEAQDLLINAFTGKTINYIEIEQLLLENTILKSTQIIQNIIKPLIEAKIIIKYNLKSKKDFKNDIYTIVGDENEEL